MANLKDFATGTVLTAPTPATTGLTLTLQSGEGALFPVPPFYANAHPDYQLPTLSNTEKILVTGVAGDVLTFSRAQSPTTAKSIAVGWRISNAVYKDDLFNSTIISNEIPGGTLNGSNTAFTIAAAFTPGTLRVHLNGQRLRSGAGNDYTENSNGQGFTMLYAPAADDVLLVDYMVGSSVLMQGTNVFINQETPTGLVNDSNTAYTTAKGYVSGTLQVYINGLLQAKGTHVTEVSPSAGTFSVDTAPSTGDIIRVSYQYAISVGGNAQSVNGISANSTPTPNQLVPLDSNGLLPSSVLGALQSWTPSYTNMAVGNGTVIAKYQKLGNKLVYFKWELTLGTTSTITGVPRITLPSTANETGVNSAGTPEFRSIGVSRFLDAGNQIYFGMTNLKSTTQFSPQPMNASGTYLTFAETNTNVPFTWGNGDAIFVEGIYEEA